MNKMHTANAEFMPERVINEMKSIREGKGLTLSDVADGSGYSRSYLSKIENGHRLPTFRALCYIYATLGYELIPVEIKNE